MRRQRVLDRRESTDVDPRASPRAAFLSSSCLMFSRQGGAGAEAMTPIRPRDEDRRPRRRIGSGSRHVALFKPYDVLTQFTDAEGRATLKDFVPVPGSIRSAGSTATARVLLLDRRRRARASADGSPVRASPDLSRAGRARSRPRGDRVLAAWGRARRRPDPAGRGRAPARAPGLPDRPVPIRFRKNVPTAWLRLVLREGRNRQVRRMTAAVGHPTLRLVRVAIGPILLGDLLPASGATSPRTSSPRWLASRRG